VYCKLLDDEIRQNEGFKNVCLGNVLSSSHVKASSPFLSPEDRDLIIKYSTQAFQVKSGAQYCRIAK